MVVLFFLCFVTAAGCAKEESQAVNSDQTKKIERAEENKISQKEEPTQKEQERSAENEQIVQMTLEEKVAQMFFVTPDALTGYPVTELDETLRNIYWDCPVGGLIMMQPNIRSPEQISVLNQRLQELSLERMGFPIFLGVDEEGGNVARIASLENFPVENVGNMKEVGAQGDIKNAHRVGNYIATYLKSYGFNVDFAPVADVWIEPENTVVQERAFSNDPDLAGAMVAECVKGFQEKNIATALKHFPGHGATTADSHQGAAYSYRNLVDLRQCEFVPFRSGIEAGSEFVMLGHIALPTITGNEIPATLSAQIGAQLLREELKYDGIVITDAMNMGAIVNYYSASDAAILAVQSGVDMILMPSDFWTAYQGVLDAVKDGRIQEHQIDVSVKRILRLKNKINSK